MPTDHHLAAPVCPLIFKTTPYDDESLPGLIARATERNVLGLTKVIRDEVGMHRVDVDLAHNDHRQLAHRLADKIGCDVTDIVLHSHEFLKPSVRPALPADRVRIGASACRRGQLHFASRRISPKTLETSEHHRIAWLHSLLPYCPESFELLIDRCPQCGKTLRWTKAKCIGTCEHCLSQIKPVRSEFLPDNLRENYRSFAMLAAGMARERQQVVDGLAPDLAALSPFSLTMLTSSLGSLIEEDNPDTTVKSADPISLATRAATGFALLDGWPHKAADAITRKLSECRNNGEGNVQFATRARKLANAPSVLEDQANLVRNSLPKLFKHIVHAVDLNRETLGIARLSKLTGLTSADIDRIRDANAISHSIFRDSERSGVVFDHNESIEFNTRLRSTAPSSRLERILDIPRYGIEQIVGMGLGGLKPETNRAVMVIDPDLRLDKAETDLFARKMLAKVQAGPCPNNVVSLFKASRLIGGGLKPWGPIIKALLDVRIPFWLTDEGRCKESSLKDLSRKILVCPRALSDFAALPEVPAQSLGTFSSSAFQRADQVTQRDAAEILNLDCAQIRPVVAAGLLTFHQKQTAHYCPLEDVVAYARQMIPAAEIGPRLGLRENVVRNWLSKNRPEIERLPGGWKRNQVFEQLGFGDCHLQK